MREVLAHLLYINSSSTPSHSAKFQPPQGAFAQSKMTLYLSALKQVNQFCSDLSTLSPRFPCGTFRPTELGFLAINWRYSVVMRCLESNVVKVAGGTSLSCIFEWLEREVCDAQGRTQGGLGGWGKNPTLQLGFYKNVIIRGVYRVWFFTKIRGLRVEEYAYYVNKLRQNVGLKTWIWHQIVTS